MHSVIGDTIETRRGTPSFNAARTTGASFLIFVGFLAGVVFAVMLGAAMLFGDGASAHPLWVVGFIGSVLAMAGGFGTVIKPRVEAVPLETLLPTETLFSELGIPFEHSEHHRAPAPMRSTQTTQQERVIRAAGAGLVGAATMAIIAAGLIGVAVVYLAGYIFGLW